MTRLFPLMQREWLQHRFGWAMMVLVPLVLAIPLIVFGQIRIDGEQLQSVEGVMPVMLATISIVATAAVLFLIATISSWIIVSGLAHRDDGDRSVEFWMSLPAGHSESLAAPMLVHLLFVPAAALVIGLAAGHLISLVLVGRVIGFGAWLSLPWATILAATLSLGLRALAGLPLALLWLSPLILIVVLLTAQFGRWGWVILAVGLGLGGWLLKALFGQALITDLTLQLIHHAAQAMVHGPLHGSQPQNVDAGLAMLAQMPFWALRDFGASLRDLVTPLFAGALIFSSACFALLVQWRMRTAAATGT